MNINNLYFKKQAELDKYIGKSKGNNMTDYKLERVRYYIDIVDRNPSQIKFLKGWIYRALRD